MRSAPVPRTQQPRKEQEKMSTPMIEVPRHLIEELTKYLDRAGEPTVFVPGQGDWTPSMIRTLKTEIARYPGAMAVANEAARQRGKLVPLTEVAQRYRINKQNISNDLSAMSKATRRLFGKKVWPFQAVDTSQKMSYIMQPEIAEWWENN
jgi:hypothetical protein